MKLKVKTLKGEQEVTLPAAGCLTIGRKAENKLCIPDESVSRKHAELRCGTDGIWVADVGSSGGTYVDGVRISEAVRLAPGSAVRIGGATLTLKGEEVSDLDDLFQNAALLCQEEMQAFKRRVHDAVLTRVNANSSSVNLADKEELRARTEVCLDQVLLELQHEIPREVSDKILREALLNELLEYGPITPLIDYPGITEIMVNGYANIFVEYKGRLRQMKDVRFLDEAHLIQVIQRIVQPIGRHVDTASPMVDARLPNGSRVNAIIQPLSLDGSSLTIRRFSEKKLTTADLISFGSMTDDMAKFLEVAVRARQNILVSGGTGSGKTTLLNILSQFIPEGERLVTVEDSAELNLSHVNKVRLEARPANVEGKGRVTIRDLVVNCLRMRPDRIIVGECRGAEALDMLQAMNTGHDGSLTTAHANSPRDALARLENMVMMAGYELPSSAIREQVASAIDFIVHQARMSDGSRKIVKIVEVTKRESDTNEILTQDIFEFRQTGIGPNGTVEGVYAATGVIPTFIEELPQGGSLTIDRDIFVPKV